MMCWIRRDEMPGGEYRLAINASDQQRLFGKGYFYLPPLPVFDGQGVTTTIPSEPTLPQLFVDNRELLSSLKAQLHQSNARYARARKISGEAAAGNGCVPCLMAFHMCLGPLIMVFAITNGFTQWGNFVAVILLACFSSLMLVTMILFSWVTYLLFLNQKVQADWLEDLATIIQSENVKWSALRFPYYLRLVKAKRSDLVYISFTTIPLTSSELNEWQENVVQLREKASESETKIEYAAHFLGQVILRILCFCCMLLTVRDEVPEGEYRLMINASDAQELFGKGYTYFPKEMPSEFVADRHEQLLASLMIRLQEAKSNYQSSLTRSRGFWLMILAIVLLCVLGAVSDEIGVHIIGKLVVILIITCGALCLILDPIMRHQVIFRRETLKWIEEVSVITNEENQYWSDYQLEVIQTKYGFFYISFTSVHTSSSGRECFGEQQTLEGIEEASGSLEDEEFNQATSIV